MTNNLTDLLPDIDIWVLTKVQHGINTGLLQGWKHSKESGDKLRAQSLHVIGSFHPSQDCLVLSLVLPMFNIKI